MSPDPSSRLLECPYCIALRRENAKHRLRDVAEREQMVAEFGAREADLERQNDALRAELVKLRPGARRPVLVKKAVRP